MSGWVEKKFRDFIKLNRGFDLPNEHMIDGKYPVVASTNIKGFHNTYKINPPAVITGRSGSLGTVQYIEQKCVPLNTTLYVKDFKGNIPKYVYYFLKTMHLEVFNSGAGVPTLNQNHLHSVKLLVPPLPTQTRIADILSAYDDAIENNNHRIALLEKAARELYKEWFVRFRFPNHTNTKFINGLPEGWEVKTVRVLAEIKSGFAFKSEWWTNTGVPVIKIKDIQNNTLNLTAFDYVEQKYADKAKNYYVGAGDLLIAMTGATIGKIALVPKSERMLVNQRVGKFFLGNEPIKEVGFLYCFFQQIHIQEQIIQLSGSNSAQPNISPDDLCNIRIIYNKKMIDMYNEVAKPIFSEIVVLQAKNKNLTHQRDLLLPRLMSGKLEV
jgi:type I restriction enzyme S subunit